MKSKDINTNLLNEEQLIALCKEGVSSGQEALYQEFANLMFRVCYRYLQEETEAEDAMIKGFVKVFNNIEKFDYRGKGSLKGWVKRIMVNECLMELRKRKMQTSPIEESTQVEVDAEIIHQLGAEHIYQLITQLPNGYRTVFNMHVVEGYPHKEIATQLGISENTSKSQLSKAKAMLRKLITENEQ
ncbi:MAG: sigma-70 family RNA polymerase sigma factor [Bacteroidota bacterium]